MSAEKLTLGTRPYDGVMPLLRGEVRIPGVELDARETMNMPQLFEHFFRGEHQVSEMSLAEAVYWMSRAKADFVCLPVFPSRMFRFGFLFCGAASGAAGPDSVNGRRIGFQRWVQTACVWMRGQLVDEYGVSPSETQWYVRSLYHWDQEGQAAITPRDGSRIRFLDGRGDPQAENGYVALLEGEVDVMGITENQLQAMLADKRARRLFADYRAADERYFRKTRIFPIMHVLCMRGELAERRPELPTALFEAFVQSKAIVRRQAAGLPSHTLASRPAYLDEEARAFGEDPWRHGLAANRHVLEKFISYCYAQGIAARKFAPEELFHPSTWKLEDRGA